jgi:hypothetical protein
MSCHMLDRECTRCRWRLLSTYRQQGGLLACAFIPASLILELPAELTVMSFNPVSEVTYTSSQLLGVGGSPWSIRSLEAASLQELRPEAEICMTAGIRRVNAWRTWTQILCTNLEAWSSGELQSSGERDNRLASTPRFASHNCPTPATPTFESPRRRFTTRRPHTRSPPSTPQTPTHTHTRTSCLG